jgi:LPS O-antigen subunit length determinant protein (WzzB/FepE family)
MTTGKEESSQSTNNETPPPQPIIYGYMPDTRGDEIDLAELISRLAKQWKLLLGITLGGTLLAGIIAFSLPKIYKPSITVSVPSVGDVAPLKTINALLESKNKNISYNFIINAGADSSPGRPLDDLLNLLTSKIRNEIIPSSPQTVFNEYYALLRSERIWSEYLHNKNSKPAHSNNINNNKGNVASERSIAINTIIEEPTPIKKGRYIDNPIRVRVDLEVQNEALGVELLNAYPEFVNKKLKEKLESDVQEIINSKLDEINERVTRLREQYKQDRLLTMQKIELENAERVARLQNTISTFQEKAKSSRESDEPFITKINDMEEKIHLIETDPVLSALKNRKSDDPWIEGLPEKLSEIDTLKNLNPDFVKVVAYSLDKSAVVAGEPIKPKSQLIVVVGFLLSMIIAILASMILPTRKTISETN